MRLTLTLLLASAAWAQTPAPAAKPDPMAAGAAAAKAAVEKSNPPAPGTTQVTVPVTVPAEGGTQTIPVASFMNLLSMEPGRVVATIDGSKVTAGDLQAILRTMPPNVQQQAVKERRQFLEQYGVMRRLSTEAAKAKLDQQSPWKEALENMRMQVLLQAEINQKLAEIQVPVEEQKKSYETNKDRFLQAKLKAIYIPFSTAPVSQADNKGSKVLTEDEAKAKAEDLLKQIRAGADFSKLAKEQSGDPTSAAKGGDFGTMKKADRLPEPVKAAVFAAKAGEVTEPLRQANGYYLFRVEEIGPQPFEQVQDSIAGELKNAQFTQWLNSVQKSIDIKEEGIEMTMEVQQPPSAAPKKPAPAPTAPAPPAPKK